MRHSTHQAFRKRYARFHANTATAHAPHCHQANHGPDLNLRWLHGLFISPLGMAIIVDMPKHRPYTILFDEHAYEHLYAIDARYQPQILRMIEEQLSFEPEE